MSLAEIISVTEYTHLIVLPVFGMAVGILTSATQEAWSGPFYGRIPAHGLLLGILVVAFSSLACASLLAFSGIVPLMRRELKFFDVATEGNIWTWANVVVLFMSAQTHACAGYFRWRRRKLGVVSCLVIAMILLGLSIDDLTALHEKLEAIGRSMGGGSGLTHFAWVVPGVLIAAGIVAIFVFMAGSVEATPRWYLLTGVIIFFSGAIGLEAVSGLVLDGVGVGAVYVLVFHGEEMLEAIGASLFVCAGVADFAGSLTVRELLSRDG